MGVYFIATFTFVVHTACNSMDVTYFSGNEWITYLYVTVSNIFPSSSIGCEIIWMPLA